MSGAKSFIYFWDSFLFSYPTPPFSTLRQTGKRQIFIRSKSVKKKSTATKIAGEAKVILQTKSGTLGGAGDPQWWFFRVKCFIRFLDVSPPNKNSQINGFSPKFPPFFYTKLKKPSIESDGWPSLVDYSLCAA